MKKFIIISAILILLAGGAFGYSLYHYMSVTGMMQPKEPQGATEAATLTTQPDASEAAAGGLAGSAGDNGIFSAGYEKASALVESMSTEERVGQLILGICSDSSTINTELSKYSLSGMLFESGNFYDMTPEQITASLHSATAETKIKPFLAAQEEGGSYTTVSDLEGFDDYDFNSPRVEFAMGGLQGLEKAEDSKTLMLRSAGFNLNLAPVIDMPDFEDQIMYSRSVSDDTETVTAYAEYTAKFNQAKGVSVALKHFPGYGTIPDSADTGEGAVVDDRAADTIRSKDYAPFKKGVEAGARFVMVSNVVVKNIDAAHTAALSPAIHSELRGTVGFSGVIMTDQLDSADYSAYADGKKPAVQAVIAGNDLILVRDYAAAYSDILSAVNDGTITETQLKDACTRVIACKYAAGIIS